MGPLLVASEHTGQNFKPVDAGAARRTFNAEHILAAVAEPYRAPPAPGGGGRGGGRGGAPGRGCSTSPTRALVTGRRL